MVLYLVPKWFFGYDVVLEFLFAIITLLVSWYAFRVYNITCEDQPRWLGAGFLFIGLAYLIQSSLNLLLLSGIDFDLVRGSQVQVANFLGHIGLVAYMVFFLIGLVILAYMTLRIDNIRLLSLLLAIALTVVFVASNQVYLFHILSMIFLGFIVLQFCLSYKKRRNTKLLWVLIAFVLLFLASVHFSFALSHPLYYVAAHIAELIAYLLILADLVMVLRT